MLAGPLFCILCQKVKQDLDHIFWHCESARLGTFCWRCSAFWLVVQEILVCCFKSPFSTHPMGRRVTFFGLRGCVLFLWVMCNEWNNKVFSGVERVPGEIWSLVPTWVKYYFLLSYFHLYFFYVSYLVYHCISGVIGEINNIYIFLQKLHGIKAPTITLDFFQH